jgi:hypothetical protein
MTDALTPELEGWVVLCFLLVQADGGFATFQLTVSRTWRSWEAYPWEVLQSRPGSNLPHFGSHCFGDDSVSLS